METLTYTDRNGKPQSFKKGDNVKITYVDDINDDNSFKYGFRVGQLKKYNDALWEVDYKRFQKQALTDTDKYRIDLEPAPTGGKRSRRKSRRSRKSRKSRR